MKTRIKSVLVAPAKSTRKKRHQRKSAPSPQFDSEPLYAMRDAGSKWFDQSVYGRAFVMPCVGSGPEQFRDRRHPDLKRVKAIKANPDIKPGTAGRSPDTRPSFKKDGGFTRTKMKQYKTYEQTKEEQSNC